MELEFVGGSDAMIRVEQIRRGILRGNSSESREWYWDAENIGKENFVCSDAVIRVSVVCI